MTPEEKKDKARWTRILRVYGITKEQFDALNVGTCPICLRTFNDTVRPVVDHNHKSGEIRGIICAYCNHRIVGRHTDGDMLHRVADYVIRTTGYIVPKKKKRTRKRKRK